MSEKMVLIQMKNGYQGLYPISKASRLVEKGFAQILDNDPNKTESVPEVEDVKIKPKSAGRKRIKTKDAE